MRMTASSRRWLALVPAIALLAAGCSKGGGNASATPVGPASSKGPSLADKMKLMNALVGKPAPDWELKDHAGKLWKLKDLHDKVVLMMCWSTG